MSDVKDHTTCTEILYLAPTIRESDLIIQKTVEKLFENGIECIASKACHYIKTPHCRVRFLSWSMGERKFLGRRCNIVINFPDDLQSYLTRGKCNSCNNNQDLLATIVKIEKGEKNSD